MLLIPTKTLLCAPVMLGLGLRPQNVGLGLEGCGLVNITAVVSYVKEVDASGVFCCVTCITELPDQVVVGPSSSDKGH